jgi:hypothetical protein
LKLKQAEEEEKLKKLKTEEYTVTEAEMRTT